MKDNINSNLQTELNDVYRDYTFSNISKSEKKIEKRLVDAISDGLKLSMIKHDNLVIMGQDILEYGGVFKVTDGFVEQFGKDRVRNTPICESAFVSALGLSINGHKAVMEMQFV